MCSSTVGDAPGYATELPTSVPVNDYRRKQDRVNAADNSTGKAAVLTEVRGHTLIVTINRPEARNALNGEAARGIAGAMDQLDASESLRVGVLTGTGGNFCSGLDLKAFLTGDLPLVEGRGFGGLAMSRPRKPLIAAVEGWAVAGGFELMLACDLVVAGISSMFGLPEVARGLVAGGGGAKNLPRRIPQAVALEMLLTGSPISAERAAGLGLVNRVTPDTEVLAAAIELAESIAAHSPLAVSVAKQIAYATSDWTDEEGWREQVRLTQPVYESEDAREGARAFAEKRAPRWTGR